MSGKTIPEKFYVASFPRFKLKNSVLSGREPCHPNTLELNS